MVYEHKANVCVHSTQKMILVCDKHYAEKADSRNGGVGWETMIVQGRMMADTQSYKYIFIGKEFSVMVCRYMCGLNIHFNGQYQIFRKMNLYYLFDCDIALEREGIPLDIRKKLYKTE